MLVAVGGPSGAGKSSLAHHVLGQVARRRLGRLRGEPAALAPSYQPCVTGVEGLPPCIEIKQEPLRGQNRSTVGTYSGILHLFAGLFMRYGESRSPGGASVLSVTRSKLADWLMRHHSGELVTRATIRSDVVVGSVSQLPPGRFYLRQAHTAWAGSSRQEIENTSEARWWIATPIRNGKIKSREDAQDFVSGKDAPSLWVIGDATFVEESWHRIAEDDPLPYEPLGPSLFSFNISRPGGGQCSVCGGLGVVQGVDERSLILDPKLPILLGGLNLPSSGRRFAHLGVLDDILRGLFHLHGLPANVAWQRLPQPLQQIVIHGSGSELIPEMPRGDTRPRPAKRPFPGIVPLLLARTRSTGPAARVFRAWVNETACPDCHGSRFNRSARASKWKGHGLTDIVSEYALCDLAKKIGRFSGGTVGGEANLVRSLQTILSAYDQLNLGHVSLNRATSKLSGGEAQRLKLGLGLALELRDACYILDEPSRGLHAQDLGRLADMLRSVVAAPNSVIMVEHRPRLLECADHLVLLGPSGGSEGGQVVFEGPPRAAPGEQSLSVSVTKSAAPRSFIEARHVQINNLNGVNFRVPTGLLTAVVGVSGAGKSSALMGALVPAAQIKLEGGGNTPDCEIHLPKQVQFVEVVGQRLAAQNRRSVVATVLNIFDPLRTFFAQEPQARAMALTAADFSFNSTGGCPGCAGTGVARDGFGRETAARCHVCGGSRFAGAALIVRSHGFGIAELLALSIGELEGIAHPAFDYRMQVALKALMDLGLAHLALGRATPTLSAGERQRLVLARFLAQIEADRGTGLLVLDEPTAGLSIGDAQNVFQRIGVLAHNHGHTVIALEHKLEVLRYADWIIEFGPGGGPAGGRVIFEGTAGTLQRKETPTAVALNASRAVSSKERFRPLPKTPRSSDHVEWERCADVFEPLAANTEVRDEVGLVRPVRPAVRLDVANFSPEVRVGEILELLKWARAHGQASLSSNIVLNDNELVEAIGSRAFEFSPVSQQRRLGLAVLLDLQAAVQSLSRLGFKQARVGQRHYDLGHLLKVIRTANDLSDCWVICPSGAPSSVREAAIRWSAGLVSIPSLAPNRLVTTHFLGQDAIGLEINSPFVGDYRSPEGWCKQCIGSGRLPSYQWDLVVRDDRRGIADDRFWQPPVLDAIRSLRRVRLLPEGGFLAKQLVGDFLQSPAKMDARTRLLFEHGVPWRRFVKPKAPRSDREQDYYSWRGLHDYVHLVLGRVASPSHSKRLKEGFRELVCPCCAGTGMGWEASLFELRGRSLIDHWHSTTLDGWHQNLKCRESSLIGALKVGLGKLRPNDRLCNIPIEDSQRLLVSMVHTATLNKLTVLAQRDMITPISKQLVKATGMQLVESLGT